MPLIFIGGLHDYKWCIRILWLLRNILINFLFLVLLGRFSGLEAVSFEISHENRVCNYLGLPQEWVSKNFMKQEVS